MIGSEPPTGQRYATLAQVPLVHGEVYTKFSTAPVLVLERQLWQSRPSCLAGHKTIPMHRESFGEGPLETDSIITVL